MCPIKLWRSIFILIHKTVFSSSFPLGLYMKLIETIFDPKLKWIFKISKHIQRAVLGSTGLSFWNLQLVHPATKSLSLSIVFKPYFCLGCISKQIAFKLSFLGNRKWKQSKSRSNWSNIYNHVFETYHLTPEVPTNTQLENYHQKAENWEGFCEDPFLGFIPF